MLDQPVRFACVTCPEFYSKVAGARRKGTQPPARGKGTSARKPYLKEIADMALASGLFIFAVKQVSCKVHKSSISRIVKKNQGVSVFINEYDFHVHAQLACGVLV